jgi:CheY-like chemotaxis protein
VDDEAPVRELAEALLTGHGYRVFTACTGEEALAFYRERASEIDLVALDLGMPGMGGKACLEQLRRLNPDVRVLVVSGYSVHSQAKGIRELGAAGFLNKPYRIFELLQAVRQALGGSGASGSS